jgi:hypothetical protein
MFRCELYHCAVPNSIVLCQVELWCISNCIVFAEKALRYFSIRCVVPTYGAVLYSVALRPNALCCAVKVLSRALCLYTQQTFFPGGGGLELGGASLCPVIF